MLSNVTSPAVVSCERFRCTVEGVGTISTILRLQQRCLAAYLARRAIERHALVVDHLRHPAGWAGATVEVGEEEADCQRAENHGEGRVELEVGCSVDLSRDHGTVSKVGGAHAALVRGDTRRTEIIVAIVHMVYTVPTVEMPYAIRVRRVLRLSMCSGRWAVSDAFMPKICSLYTPGTLLYLGHIGAEDHKQAGDCEVLNCTNGPHCLGKARDIRANRR